MFLVLLLVPRWKKLSCQVTSGDIPSVVALDPWAPKTWAGQAFPRKELHPFRGKPEKQDGGSAIWRWLSLRANRPRADFHSSRFCGRLTWKFRSTSIVAKRNGSTCWKGKFRVRLVHRALKLPRVTPC